MQYAIVFLKRLPPYSGSLFSNCVLVRLYCSADACAGSIIFQLCLIFSAWLKFAPQQSSTQSVPRDHAGAAVAMTVILSAGVLYTVLISLLWSRSDESHVEVSCWLDFWYIYYCMSIKFYTTMHVFFIYHLLAAHVATFLMTTWSILLSCIWRLLQDLLLNRWLNKSKSQYCQSAVPTKNDTYVLLLIAAWSLFGRFVRHSDCLNIVMCNKAQCKLLLLLHLVQSSNRVTVESYVISE